MIETKTDYTEVRGDLIYLARKGKFDVIAHGCNCMSNMGAGIAVQMNHHFDVSTFPMEMAGPDVNKLGNIDYQLLHFEDNHRWVKYPDAGGQWVSHSLTVVNAYTQYFPSVRTKPLDYEALTLCMRKMNIVFKGRHIGLPQIGAGLAGGDWDKIKEIIKRELKDCKVTVVIYDRK